VGLPDAPARYKLLEIHLADKPLAEDVELGALCDKLNGYSGADIKYICQEAAQEAFLDALNGQAERTVGQADLLGILGRTPPSVRPADLVRFEKFKQTGG
jgi:SpoVK/Ycf46/Vps4 family AAA+-type ATPase